MRRPFQIIAFVGVRVLSIHGTEPSATAYNPRVGADDYKTIVRPFLDQYCLKCHGPQKPKGDFRVDATGLSRNFNDRVTVGKWKEIVNVLNSHEMPPKKER